MKHLALALIVSALAAIATAQQETTATTGASAADQKTTPEAGPPAAESDLVRAARLAKWARTKKAKKVITNADVKKSTGKLTTLSATAPLPAAPETKSEKGTIEKQDEQHRARQEASERVAAAEKKVDELERELGRLEQNFYDTNDPNYRDDVIQKRFEQTKRQLDDAKKELADARDALSATSTKR